MKTRITDMDMIEKFMVKVNVGNKDVCWIWLGGYGSKGRGAFTYKGVWNTAAVVSYRIHNGNISPGLIVRHTCDNPSCVNPNHLILGSTQDNIDDMISRGRAAPGSLKGNPGSLNGRALLNEQDVIRIKKLLQEDCLSLRDIAEDFGVSISTIFSIKQGKNWSHIEIGG